MSSKADLKRLHIIQTAIQYLKDNDVSTLTLDKIASRGNISKGGLLYHFKTKDALQTAIAETILNDVMHLYEHLASQEQGTGRLTRAFILASQKDLAKGASLNIAIQILQQDHASIASAYECLLEELFEDGLEVSIVHLIRLTIDGLYYSKRLNIAPISTEAIEGVFEQLMQMTRKEYHI
ncbi:MULTISPECIES: TetR/AcrR family transcriptional regulator [unclassified Lysinibacillus]|uniref:TetR/AcrR family transcriptional regulator n=1 Tax=unclassified Lysinibacillus TaxID=2636778 RepID=UPI002553011C|nr:MULTISPECIES: TetR/AcrR family transcriptional regulator [unclassified Lysinibacillus]MDM5247690.1 TetR/AcrR family transcriptional regulator [Lysinibacillus sp. G4S2]